MRHTGPILIIFFAVITSGCFAQKTAVKHHNRIDEINTAEEIQALILSVDTNIKYLGAINDPFFFQDRYCISLADSIHAKPWMKGDFDNNGYTDMIVEYYSSNSHQNTVLCIMDSGDNRFHFKFLQWYRHDGWDCTFDIPFILDHDLAVKHYDHGMILYQAVDTFYIENTDTIRGYVYTKGYTKMDTLVYKFGGFIEYNGHPEVHKIESIRYTSVGGWTPLEDRLTIKKDKSAEYSGDLHGNRGSFKAVIDDDHYNTLIALINYTNFINSDTLYGGNISDMGGYRYSFTFDKGRDKTIEDYGMGTFALIRLREMLAELLDNQRWESE